MRIALEDLRIGIADGTLRDAIVWANFPEVAPASASEEPADRELYKEYVQLVQDAYDRTSDFARIAVLAKQGKEALQAVKLTIGLPVKCMLATREPSYEKAFARTGTPAQLEYKYDGFRVQVHHGLNGVSLFTRRLENVTVAFPDIVKVVKERTPVNCLFDAEAIGIDKVTKRYVPFQQISQRIRRKHNIAELVAELPMQLVLFDVLVWDGEEVLKLPQSERFKLLQDNFPSSDNELALATAVLTSDVSVAQDFFTQAKAAGCEGIMVKSTTAPYRPGARVGDWVKQKETMENLDLVVIGAEWGEGKRSGWLTSFELAVRDETGEFLAVGRVGTGLKEIPSEGLSFGEVTELLRPHILLETGKLVTVAPAIVLEIAFEEIQRSPSYRSGFALRFPRVILNRSDERGPEDITSLAYLEQLFAQQ